MDDPLSIFYDHLESQVLAGIQPTHVVYVDGKLVPADEVDNGVVRIREVHPVPKPATELGAILGEEKG